eukprot:TRINITY_DN30145_c0_g1_i1.p1 TRINITY_DN30145_c0_g1~~TRINITY_DN30145_c0_g1_i1.p1  ORF type:complete len:674 (+),score=105.31 TRINITY_DN30145_c0_g1_i1:86-2107(+)
MEDVDRPLASVPRRQRPPGSLRQGPQVKTRFKPPPLSGLTLEEQARARSAAAACCGGPALPLAETDVTVFVAEKIITMDPSWPDATAVAVGEGKILSVGTLESLHPWMKTARTVVVDRTFEDKVLLPGFIDPHQHLLIGGMALSLHHTCAYYETPNPYGPPIPGVTTKEALLNRMRSIAETLPNDEPLLAWGYDSVAMGGHLDKEWLDQVSTTRRVSMWDCSMHFGYCNTMFLRSLGRITAAPGVGFGSDGKPNGQFLGVTAMRYFAKNLAMHFGKPRNALQAMKHNSDLYHQGGITTVAEMLLGGVNMMLEFPLLKEFMSDPGCPVRVLAVVDAKKLQDGFGGSSAAAINWVKDLADECTERLMFNGGVKFFSDDAFVGLTMQMSEPGYIDGHEGIWINEGKQFSDLMMPYWKAGLRLHVHSNGTGGQENTLAALAALQAEHPRFDHRFCFEHYGMSTQAISRRVKTLGASCSVNAMYPHLRGEINEQFLGTDRAHLASRLKSLVDLGVPTAMHTDTPVAAAVPLQEMWVATERRGQSGKILAPAERINRYQALKMKTLDAAYIIGLDHLVGSIEAGKFADFTVLHDDPLTYNGDIRQIKIWGTVVGGEKYIEGRKWDLRSKAMESDDFLKPFLGLKAKWATSFRPLWRLAARAFGATVEQANTPTFLYSKL